MNVKYPTLLTAVITSIGGFSQFATIVEHQGIQPKMETRPALHIASDDRAPGDEIISDDFSDFGNWTVYTEGGTVPDWELLTTTPADVVDFFDLMESPSNENGFACFNGIQYLLDGDVPVINALVEFDEIIDCSGTDGVSVTFFAAYRAFNEDKIYLEATNNDWLSFESYELYDDLATNSSVQEFHTVNISAVASGETEVKIRFRFKELSGNDAYGAGYAFMIDDLLVSEPLEHDLEITASYHRSGMGLMFENGLDYFRIPETQYTEISFIGTTDNIGSGTRVNAKLNTVVSGVGTYTGSSLGSDILPLESDSAICSTTFTPTTIGLHDITYWFDADELDDDTSNDTLYSVPIICTDDDENYTYARDNYIATSSIGNVTSNEGAPLLIGNVMDIFGDDTIGAVEIQITDDATNVGQLIFGQIMRFNEDDGGYIYVDQTNDHVITADDNGTNITLYFEEYVAVEAGETILLLAGHYGGADEVRFQMAQHVEANSVLGYTSGASDPFTLLNPTAIMVRIHMEHFADTDGDGIWDVDEFDVDDDGDGPDDSDEDGTPDYLDDDDDGDGVPTEDELGEGDTDGDGILDYLDTDDDGDGILTEDELVEGDTDGDGILDYLDTDDDGDGILTEDELGAGDSDGDGIDDYLDDDDDGDGVPTEDELGEGDTDGDDIPDYLDDDDDGDGVLTEDELGEGDTDDDGILDYLDTDDDGDGILTMDEYDVDEDGVPDDTDGDGVPDYLDPFNTVGIDELEGSTFKIGQNVPNPFSDFTTFSYELSEAADVNVQILSISGQVIQEINMGNKAPGNYTLRIDANDFAAGIYFFAFSVNGIPYTGKMVVAAE